MQYDTDITSNLSQPFKTIRKLLLSYPTITETKHAKQTSYYDNYGVVVMMRTKGDLLVVAFGRGAMLQEKFPQLQGKGKVVRHLYLKEGDVVDEALIREMVEESIVLGIEAEERKRMRGLLR